MARPQTPLWDFGEAQVTDDVVESRCRLNGHSAGPVADSPYLRRENR